MKNLIHSVMILMLSVGLAGGVSAQKGEILNLVVGTFTDDGLQVFDFNDGSGDVTLKTKEKILGTCFIAISKDHKYIYTANQENNEGWVYAFEFNPTSAELKLLNKVSSGGSNPSYITLDQKGVNAIVSHYNTGNVSVLPVQKDGSIGAAIQVIQHEGTGVNLPRQDRARAHSTVFTPDNKYLMVGDLGIDKIMMYKYDASDKKTPLTAAAIPFFAEKPGGGTRVIVVHPNKKFIYSIQELVAEVTAYSYNDGTLTMIETEPMMEGAQAPGTLRMAADLQISPDGKFLYASNRGEANEIVIYAIDTKSGKLDLVGKQSSLGRSPRYIAIDPAGNYVLASNMGAFGGGRRGAPPAGTPGQPAVAPAGPPPPPPAPPVPSTITIFKRDKTTGLLKDTGKKIDVVQPGFLLFVPR